MNSAVAFVPALLVLIAVQRNDAMEIQKPNILFVVSDDLATRVGCYGDAAAITPNLDRLAAEGTVFEKAYVQGTVCTPSRTAFMLGLNNRSARRNHFREHPDTMTMGRFFRQNGYQTFSVGKIDHTDEFVDPEAWDIRAQENHSDSKLPLNVLREPGPQGRPAWRHAIVQDTASTQDSLIADRAIHFMNAERDAKRPFFAAIGFHKPHQPAVSTQRHFDAHGATAAFPFLATPPDASPIAPGHLYSEPGLELTEADAHLARRSYYASVSHMDEQLGRVLDALEKGALTENTLVVYTSDHGYHLGWRGQWAKHDMSEEVMRVPLVIRWPSVTAPGTRTKGIVELIDLFPTLAEAAAAEEAALRRAARAVGRAEALHRLSGAKDVRRPGGRYR